MIVKFVLRVLLLGFQLAVLFLQNFLLENIDALCERSDLPPKLLLKEVDLLTQER